jgi:hypothetical protein
VHLEAVVVFIVAVLLLLAAHVAEDVLHIHVSLEFVLVEEILVAELAVGVHEGDVPEFVHVSLLEVLAQGLVCVQLLLLQHACLFLYAYFAILVDDYQTYLLWSYFRCFLRKATEGNFLSNLQGFPSILMKHLHYVNFSKALLPLSELKKISAKFLSGSRLFLKFWKGTKASMTMMVLRLTCVEGGVPCRWGIGCSC